MYQWPNSSQRTQSTELEHYCKLGVFAIILFTFKWKKNNDLFNSII